MTELISNAHITTSGSAEAILTASHVKRSRYVHQVNAAVLYSLLQDAFKNTQDDYDKWLSSCREKLPHFEYWFILLELECLMLSFVKSIRGKFREIP